MAIRLRQVARFLEGTNRNEQQTLGDITASTALSIFIAPVPCVVNAIDIYSRCAAPPETTSASTTNFSASFYSLPKGMEYSATENLMVAITGSSTALGTASITANARFRVIPTANNSLTAGSVIKFYYNPSGSCVLSGVLVSVHYTPLIHRDTR